MFLNSKSQPKTSFNNIIKFVWLEALILNSVLCPNIEGLELEATKDSFWTKRMEVSAQKEGALVLKYEYFYR